MDKRVLILARKKEDQIDPVTFELLRVGREITDKVDGNLCVAVLGHGIDDMIEGVAYFANEIYSLNNPLLASLNPELYATALEQLCQYLNPEILLMSHTFDNLDLAPRLAYKLRSQVMTDCVHLSIDQEKDYLLCTKPIYGAKFVSTFILRRKPYVITFRSKAVEPIGLGSEKGEVIHFAPVLDERLIKVELTEMVREESVDLEKAEVIVSGGRGIKNNEGLELIKELVRVLTRYFSRVELGASRPLVDAHLVSSSRQIGLTGQKVAPEIYFAIGISGSLQHVTGILGSNKIIAVNENAKALIFEVADYGVIGKFEEVVPAFIKKVKELQ